TEILVDEVLVGAKEAGAEIEKIKISKVNMLPCLGCGVCQKKGECVQKDDISMILDKMSRSQIWVLGTPVYWNGPTGQFKTFMDRWYAAKPGTFAKKKIIITIPLAESDSRFARHIIGMLTDSLGKEKIFATLIAPGAFNSGEVRQNTEIMQKARSTGKDIVKKILTKSSESP
ncbi:MAG: flavodoxin family protein, partial [Candidatus Hodarchaeales archaeon]